MTSANHFANNMAKIAIGAKVANYNTGSRIVWTIAEPSASSASETALWRSALQQQLSCLFNE